MDHRNNYIFISIHYYNIVLKYYVLHFINIYYKYFDEDEGKEVDNPFIKLLVNERKIKLKYDNKWYDLIIKSIQENSEIRWDNIITLFETFIGGVKDE